MFYILDYLNHIILFWFYFKYALTILLIIAKIKVISFISIKTETNNNDQLLVIGEH